MNKHLDEELTKYAQRRLVGRARARVENHVIACPACSAQLSEIEEIVETQLAPVKRLGVLSH